MGLFNICARLCQPCNVIHRKILFFQEAKALPGVGKRLAEKIWEIAESGELRKLNEFKSSDEIRVIEMFKDLWGAGATTARAWYQQVRPNKKMYVFIVTISIIWV